MKRKELKVGKNIKINGVHYCATHSGKMAGMISLSTSCTNNTRCQERAASDDANNICAHCFSFSQMAHYSSMVPCYENNTDILTSRILSDDEIPVINHMYFRFESFGDLNNSIQVINYFKIASMNKSVKCALWTKNPDIIESAIKAGYKKPANLVIIVSSHLIDSRIDIDRIKTLYPFIDKVFTVYNPETVKAENITINCGARSCLACGKCYSKKKTGKYINELLK